MVPMLLPWTVTNRMQNCGNAYVSQGRKSRGPGITRTGICVGHDERVGQTSLCSGAVGGCLPANAM